MRDPVAFLAEEAEKSALTRVEEHVGAPDPTAVQTSEESPEVVNPEETAVEKENRESRHPPSEDGLETDGEEANDVPKQHSGATLALVKFEGSEFPKFPWEPNKTKRKKLAIRSRQIPVMHILQN